MATGKLSALAAAGMQSYVAGLSPPKEENYNFQDGYDAVFNQIEDYWDRIVEIESDYTIPENNGNILIVVKNTGFTSTAIIELPAITTNIGRKISVINENIVYPVMVLIKSGSGDNIEGFTYIGVERTEHQDRLTLVATQNGWRRLARNFCSVPENRRPAGYVLTNGSASAWTDVSFTTWVHYGCYCVLLRYAILHIGNDTNDFALFHLRPKGSTVDNFFRNTFVMHWFTNLTTGYTTGHAGIVAVKCDYDGVIQYRQYVSALSGNGTLSLTIEGYWR